jgi:rsbT co-antagonist protein RsbR
LGDEIGADAARLRKEVWTATKLLDKLGLYTIESYQKGREAIMSRQSDELLELSTSEGMRLTPLSCASVDGGWAAD